MARPTIDRYIKTLLGCGLSPSEARLYFAALTRGPSRIAELSSSAGMKRTTAYSIVQGLVDKGILVPEVHGFRRKFAAIPPDGLKVLLLRQVEQLDAELPHLQQLYAKQSWGGGVRVHEELDSVRTAFQELLGTVQPGDFYYVITDYDAWEKLDPAFFKGFIERRRQKGVELQLLLNDVPSLNLERIRARHSLKQVRLLPPHCTAKVNVVITPRRLLMLRLEPPTVATVTDNKAFIDFQSASFNILWEAARKIS